jgi:hypothetical protein
MKYSSILNPPEQKVQIALNSLNTKCNSVSKISACPLPYASTCLNEIIAATIVMIPT